MEERRINVICDTKVTFPTLNYAGRRGLKSQIKNNIGIKTFILMPVIARET